MPVRFAVNIVRRKVCIVFSQSVTLLFTQDHNSVANLTSFKS